MEVGWFCPSTEAAVRSFQEQRGLHADGVCDEHTWTALVEATWKFGDRLLFLTSPSMRGDDVVELQSKLARLGFDCGRVDGILGPRTSNALIEFQSNCGLLADGVCGPLTLRTIATVSSQSGTGPGVSAIREQERQRTGFESIANCRIVLGQFTGLTALIRSVTRELRQHGATVMPLDEPDPVAQALAANQFGAHVYLGVETSAEPMAMATYYQVPSYESVGGRALADTLAAELRTVSGLHPVVRGMRLPVLRETRMPAVMLTIGSPRRVADAGPALAEAMLRALELWILRAT
jgi:N-acetylmuramoyl-L-alanine amidase